MKSTDIRVGEGSRTGFRFAFGSLLATGVILLAGCSSTASSLASAAGVPGVEAAPAAMAAPSPASRDSAFGSLQNTADAAAPRRRVAGRCPTWAAR